MTNDPKRQDDEVRIWPVPGRPDRVDVEIRMPAAVRRAFDAAFAMHRRIVGPQASVESFIEALVATERMKKGGPLPRGYPKRRRKR